MRKNLRGFKKDFKYTWEHKKAFIKMEKELTGKISIQGLLHDTDKLFLYLLFTKAETSNIHRTYARHHMGNNVKDTDTIQMLIDWECNRITKPDKQETARQFMQYKYPNLVSNYEWAFESLGI